MMKQSLALDVYFDFICPWCLIGKRQLQQAIEKLQATHPKIQVAVQWHGVQLLPTIPTNGLDFKEFYIHRLGSAAAVSMRQAQVREAANSVGVDINFDRIQRMPNTAKAHHVFSQASSLGNANQHQLLLEALFSAYFHQVEDISDPNTLLKIATACGYPIAPIQAILDNSTVPYTSVETGGNGVPYFVFNGLFGVAGAVPALTLYQAMLEALLDTTAIATLGASSTTSAGTQEVMM